jgi:hypothetical protein
MGNGSLRTHDLIFLMENTMAQNTHARSAQSQSARRRFFAGTAKSGMALSALSLAATGVTGMGISMASAAQVASASSTPDLLMTLGARIAIEVQSALGSAESGYSVHFLDAAGPSCAGLREGLTKAFQVHGLQFEASQGECHHALGVVTIRNLDTGRSAKVELFPESLSQVDLIEQSFSNPALRDQAIMKTPRDSLFSLS